MADEPDFDPVAQRDIGRIEAVSADHHTVRVLTSSGAVLTFTGEDLQRYAPGDSVVIGSMDNQGFLMPTDINFEPSEWIGVVKHVDGDEVVCEIGGRFVMLERGGLDCEVGCTVLGDSSNRLLRVITRRPLKYIDLPGDQELDVSHFRARPSGLSFDDFGGYADVVRRAKNSSRSL